MRRLIALAATGLAFLLALAPASHAMPFVSLKVGAYGVSNIPLVQDDAEKGGLFGIRGRVGLLNMLAVEPSVNFLNNGDAENVEGSTVTLKAPDVTSVAFNLIWGGSYYGTVGVGWSSVDVPGGLGSSSEATYNFGSGLEIGVGLISVDVGVRLFVINTADSASRKNLAIMAGANYAIF